MPLEYLISFSVGEERGEKNLMCESSQRGFTVNIDDDDDDDIVLLIVLKTNDHPGANSGKYTISESVTHTLHSLSHGQTQGCELRLL